MTKTFTFFSPCKVNYVLAITGVRADGFHNLISLVAPTRFGDEIEMQEDGADSITCNLEGVPLDESNLVMKAASLFRSASGINRFFKFNLIKKVPHGAGLGGGSANGAITLAALNKICDNILSDDELLRIAATLGSDCPLFLKNKPLIMRGRGELLSDIPTAAQNLISSIKLLIFKPDFAINTAWAYKTMREDGNFYIPENRAEKMLNDWLENPTIDTLPLFNNMQEAAFKKFPALLAILDFVKQKYKIPALMSGSGSACFAIVNSLNASELSQLKSDLKQHLGQSCFIADA